MKIIQEIRRYYGDPAAIIPSLNLANGSSRQQRTERREACLIVLACLLHYLDLASLRVGIPHADLTFQGISMPFIADKCGLTLRRTERAVADLVRARLITVHPICEKISDCIYKGYAAIRTISRKLFVIFGLGGRLNYERDRASARQRKKTAREAAKSKAKMDLVIDSAVNGGTANKTDVSEAGSNRVSALRIIKKILNDTS